MLVDSHCHLDYLEREGDSLEEVVTRAQRAGVGRLVTISTKLSEFDTIRGIAERFAAVYCSVGVHPHEAGEEGVEDPQNLLSRCAHPKVVGIGETGLDYFYEHSPREAQQRSFRAHIAAARESGLPLIVHARDADADTVAILQEEHARGAFPGVIHCFTAGPELAQAALEIGFYISLAGVVTFKKAEALRETVRQVPLERLLVETDSPYLAPVPKRGKRNEPAYVVHTAEKMAELMDVSADELAEATTANFFRLFSKVPAPQ
ncbi:TatD family hydrolase [Aquibaculum arenosum]|uniref:TatD family hydrolase n=1 Tax=Aquibaculum arenosum TaxID=3032591 RepID=A0ABT5YML2_9PROT|nr:TatD family hydrolase [Fodinicurvata sp. CAU 1616]MDF2096196.1 TatD family hydrolase [Fodinicurvata sp. CAU 1616]